MVGRLDTDLAECCTYALELEPRGAAPEAAPSEAAVLAYYQAHVPAGGSALEQIRDHVIDAMQKMAPAPSADDVGARALDLHLLVTLADDFEALTDEAVAGEARPRDFLALHSQLWFAAAEGAAALGRIRAAVEADPRARGRRLFGPDDVRQALVGALAAVERLVRDAAAAGRRFRFVLTARAVPFDAQLEVLATAGIRPRAGTTREMLLFNTSEEEAAAAPWRELDDFFTCSDDVADFALKCLDDDSDRDIYGRYAGCMRDLARGRLPLADIESAVDFEEGTAFLAFSLDGEPHRLTFAWRGRWIDASLFSALDDLLRRRARGWAFYTMEMDVDRPSESLPLFCLDRSAFLRLRAAGVPITLLRVR